MVCTVSSRRTVLPEDRGVAAELTLPLLVQSTTTGQASARSSSGKKCAPEQRRHARQLESGCGYRRDADDLHASVLGDQVPFVVAEGAQLRDGFHLVAPLEEVVARGAGLAEPAGADGGAAGDLPS